MQGDHIEHPDYIKEKNIKLDYAFYITNQIQVPVSQILELEYSEGKVLEIFDESLDILNPEIKYLRMLNNEIKELCVQKGLKSKGVKSDSIKYLMDPENPEYKDTSNPMEEKYKKMLMKDLKELCDEKGIDTKGKKAELIEKLLK